jgi:peptide/nickel transport system substrate-binding protein
MSIQSRATSVQASSLIGRRQFLMSSVGAGFASASFLALPQSARAGTPRAGGRLRLAATEGGVTDVLDPAIITGYFCFLLNWAIRNNLVEVDADGIAQPELAESWDASADATIWKFKLRNGVQFHNGKSLTADDVLWSINHHRGADSHSAAKGLVDQIADLKADGTDAVVFTLKSGNLDFPYILSDQHFPIAPNGTTELEWNKGIGTGGYVLKSWQPGNLASLVRNPNYWKAGKAHFDAVDILNVADVSARTSALLSDAADIIGNPDLKTINHVKSSPSMQVLDIASNGHASIPMFVDVSPFNNIDVRLALKYGIDREAFVKKILYGHGTLGNDQPINETYRYYAKDLPQRVYDPDKAKFHLKKAGLGSLRVNLSAADAAFGGALDAAVLYSAQAAKSGVDIHVVREPDDAYWANVWMKKAFCMSFWNGRSTPDWMFSIGYARGGPWNETHWDNDRFNKLLIGARIERDEQKRADMYREMQSLVRDDGGAVIPAFENYVMAATAKLQHGKVANNWNFDGFRLIERWWFA